MTQSPFIFTGSIKFNIDPFGSICDAQIEKVLNKVGLEEIVSTFGLHSEILSLDLSVGQKQLLALCRLLLTNNRIILLDEATANLDELTEKKIHEIIEDYFSDRTIISIAHKLRVVRNYDLVMLIDNGSVLDILPPGELITREHTRLHKSVIE
jgi:ABC-type multidrug transport system fused ATPase/permease subunit